MKLIAALGGLLVCAITGCGGGGSQGPTPAQAQEPTSETLGLNQVCAENASVVIYTVPTDRTFILTDAIGLGTILRRIGGATSPLFTVSGETHLCSGFDFPPDSQIVYQTPPGQPGVPTSDEGCITVAGRLQ